MVMRTIDANVNRAMEGLRVVEEVARMVLEEPAMFGKMKSLRHDIHVTILDSPVTTDELVRSRRASTDVGRAVQREDEAMKKDIHDILGANFRRLQEALRVLEEFFKLLDIPTSLRFREIRFGVYILQEELFRMLHAREDEENA
jgi:thiamine-phosphate pyrophosphorylase